MPVLRVSNRERSSRLGVPLLIAATAVLVVAALLGPAVFFFAVTLATLMVAGAALFHTLHEPIPKRLVPKELAGNLAVKLSGKSILVGRLPCCRVEIPLPTVSSHHCLLARVGSRWYIEDLDSRNGTFVNGRQVRKKRLRVGDQIAIGEFKFRVE